jgi:hypothetical protein
LRPGAGGFGCEILMWKQLGIEPHTGRRVTPTTPGGGYITTPKRQALKERWQW